MCSFPFDVWRPGQDVKCDCIGSCFCLCIYFIVVTQLTSRSLWDKISVDQSRNSFFCPVKHCCQNNCPTVDKSQPVRQNKRWPLKNSCFFLSCLAFCHNNCPTVDKSQPVRQNKRWQVKTLMFSVLFSNVVTTIVTQLTSRSLSNKISVDQSKQLMFVCPV